MTMPRSAAGGADRARSIARASARRSREPVRATSAITLSHGSGGKASHSLIDGLILPALGQPALTGA